MKREILVLIVLSCVMALIPMVVLGQNNGTKLKILIPAREFTEFVTIQRNVVTGENNYSGFAIEVFSEVMNTALPSPVPFEFVPFQKPDGTMNGSFDEMLEAVASKNYDGAVGEISIVFYRTQWVDFTMPFLESSISMLVPIEQRSTIKESTGFSLIGITYTFIITTFVLGSIAFIIAAIYAIIICWNARLPRENNRMPRDRTLGSLIQTKLLTTTFFVILLTLVGCYIASQTSSNTSQNRKSTVKNLTQLIRKGSNVGYREGSFIYNLLLQKGIPESKLISLKSEGEMVDMLSKGTSKDGVDAIVANAPHLKLLQAKHCDKFTMVPTTNLHATGFGFAFGKGSSLVKDVSNGILKLVDKGRLGRIQERTIGSLETCQDDPNTNLDAASLLLAPEYQWILITGAVLVVLLTIVSFIFLF